MSDVFESTVSDRNAEGVEADGEVVRLVCEVVVSGCEDDGGWEARGDVIRGEGG